MKNLFELLSLKAGSAIQAAFASEMDAEAMRHCVEITQATQPQFGHYQCNSALKIAKLLKKNPREIAAKLITYFSMDLGAFPNAIEKLEIAGAGFINIFLTSVFVSQEATEMLKTPFLGIERPDKRQRVIVEFSSPNIAKELHVGHLRSTIIGDALARLFEFLGEEVIRLNHIGDWGTQFGMLIAFLEERHPDIVSAEVDLSQLMQWYRESKKLFDLDTDFKKKAQLRVVALQAGEEKARKLWERICEISRQAYQEIYDLMDVKLKERGESFYNPSLKAVVDELTSKGLVTISEGARCIFLEEFTTREGTALPMIIQKADGGYNYDTTDMAAIRHRIFDEKADRIIVVTDAGQSLHFQMVEKVARLAGYFDARKVRFDHVPFGVVLGADGKKFKTRSGDTEKLIDLLQESIDQAQGILKEKISDLSEEESYEMAKILGIDAVKYADLSTHRLKDYTFSYEKMLRFEGNTAAFLLYAYVRAQSIKRKVGKDPKSLLSQEKILLEHPTEVALAIHLRQFGEALSQMEKELLPNRLSDYLYTLAELFNGFFRDCRVEGTPFESSRLMLCELMAEVMKQGLHILGLKTLERM